MTDAWNSAPLTSDADMNLKVAYHHPNSDAERDKVIAAMRQNLRYLPRARVLRLKDKVITRSSSSGVLP
jgi:hypothetical protein